MINGSATYSTLHVYSRKRAKNGAEMPFCVAVDCLPACGDVEGDMVYSRGSQIISMAGHKGPKTAQRYTSEGQMNTMPHVSVFQSWQRANHELLGGWIWPTGYLLRTPSL